MIVYLIAAGLALNVAAHPTIRADVDDPSFCSPYNITSDVWEAHDMDDFIADLAIWKLMDQFKTKSAMEVWESQLGPKWTQSIYDCRDDGSGCDFHALTTFCKDAPRWTLAVGAISNYVTFLNNLEQRVTETTLPLGNLLPNFPSIFAPENATLSAGMSNDQSIASGALGLALGIFGLLPGLDLVADAAKVGTTAASAIGGVANAALGAAGLHGGTPTDVEVKFDSWATIASQLGNFQQQLTSGIGVHLNAIFQPGYITNQANISFIHDQLFKGGFAGPSFPLEPLKGASDGLTAVLASQAITTLWQWSGVVAVRVRKSDFAHWGLDYDPCDGDNLFKQDSEKWCDKTDGSMYVFQKPNADPRYRPLTDASKYKVPGLDQLGKYKLSNEIMLRASWDNQNSYGPGASGPTPDQLSKNIIAAGTANVPFDQLVFSNFLVCDYTALPSIPSAELEKFQHLCKSQGSDNEPYCYFYGLMSLCHYNDIFNKGGNNVTWPGLPGGPLYTAGS